MEFEEFCIITSVDGLFFSDKASSEFQSIFLIFPGRICARGFFLASRT